MTRSRLGILGLCAMVFGLMSFSVSAAQGETAAKWLILTSASEALKTGSELPAEINTEAEGTGILHSKIAGVAVLFECTAQSLTGNPKLGANGSIGTFQAKFSGCITKLNGATSAPCEPKAGGTEKGVIKTNSLHGLLELHELAGGVKDDVIRVLPESGETFGTIDMSEECSIGTKVPVIGKLRFKDCENLALTHLVKHLVEVGPLTELWTISKTAEHVATILGSAWAFLAGADTGLKWSGDPAQGETAAKWLILTSASGETLKTGSELPAEINTEAETSGVLHSEIAGLAVLFECTAQSLTGNPKLAGNGSIGTFQIKFSGCLTKLNGITNTFCKPSAGHTESGVIKTLNLDALFGTHVLGSGVKDDVLKVLPVSGNVFADIEMGEECAIGEKVALIGSMALEDGEGSASTHLVKHLLRVFEPLTKLFVNSETAEHAVTLLGSAWASLVGTDAGLKWSGDPKPAEPPKFIPGGKWLVLESAGVLWSEAKVNEGKASVLLEADTTWVEHTKIAGVAVLFECKKIAAINAFLLANGSVGESAGNVKGSKIKLSECITKLNGVTSAPCEPKSGGTEKGVITTAAGHAVIGLYELAEGAKDDLISFLPDSGETFYSIEMGEECSIGNKVPLIGKLYFKDCENLALTHLVKHLIEVNPLTELWVISKTPEHVVTLLGSGWASLGGAGIGKLWSGDPN